MKFNTKPPCGGFLAGSQGTTLPPVYQASAFTHEFAEKFERIFANKAPGFAYIHIFSPTMTAFEHRIASPEGEVGMVSCASGTAAVSMALLSLLQSSDEAVAGSGLFGDMLDLFEDLGKLGIHTRFVREMTAEQVGRAIMPVIRAVLTELIGNPRLDAVDTRAVAEVTALHGIPLIIDSTTTTPALIRPPEYGTDIVVHSSFKYINGSGNVISGIIVDSGRLRWDFERSPTLVNYRSMGKFAYTARLRQGTWCDFGACLIPRDAHLSCVGLEILSLCMEWLCQSALELVEFLQKQPGMAVNYPGLAGSPYRSLVESQMDGGMDGAILTLRTGSKEEILMLINVLKYVHIATNIGDARVLVIHAASTIYNHTTEQQRENIGVHDDLIRVSVGLEDIEDLKEDFAQAISKTQESGDFYGS